MPIAEITIIEGRSIEKKKALIKNVTQAICESIDAPAAAVRIIIREVPAEHWGIGGQMYNEVNKA